MLAIGAMVGLVVGIVAQVFVGGVDGELGWLVRLALLVPALVFVAWWLLVPGLRLEEGMPAVPPELQDAPGPSRLERIETVFDTAAVPRSRRTRLERPGDGLRETYRSSVRREDADVDEAAEAWRMRHSVRPAGDGTSGG